MILPAGNYVLTIPVMNTAGTNTLTQNLMGFITADGTKYLAKTLQYPVGEWYNEVITFSLIEPTAGVLSLGIQNNAGSGSAPHLFIDCVKIETTTNAEVVRAELKAALAEADKVVEAKAGIGEGLFLIPEAEYDTFAAAVAAAQAVADNTEATAEELEEAKAALATAVEAYADAKVGPEADATYTFQQKASGLYLALDAANDKVMISETAQAFTFEAGEGGYYLINEEGAVGFAGTNNWTMSANAEKKMIINPTNGRVCTCGRKGCVESEITPSAIRKKIKEIYSQENTPFLYEASKGNFMAVTKDMLIAAYEKDEKPVKEIMDNVIMLVAVLINNLYFSTNPQKIVLHRFPFRSEEDFNFLKEVISQVAGPIVASKVDTSIIDSRHRFLSGCALAIRELFYNKGGYDTQSKK